MEFDEVVTFLGEMRRNLNDTREHHVQTAKKAKSEEWRLVIDSFARIIGVMAILTETLEITSKYVQQISKTIEGLPNKEEFVQIKTEWVEFKKETKPAAQAIIDTWKGYKEREERAKDLYD